MFLRFDGDGLTVPWLGISLVGVPVSLSPSESEPRNTSTPCSVEAIEESMEPGADALSGGEPGAGSAETSRLDAGSGPADEDSLTAAIGSSTVASANRPSASLTRMVVSGPGLPSAISKSNF